MRRVIETFIVVVRLGTTLLSHVCRIEYILVSAGCAVHSLHVMQALPLLISVDQCSALLSLCGDWFFNYKSSI